MTCACETPKPAFGTRNARIKAEMPWDRIEERLKQLKDSAREQWSSITHQDPEPDPLEKEEAHKRSVEWINAIKEMAAVESHHPQDSTGKTPGARTGAGRA